jgi:hypothetical protein
VYQQWHPKAADGLRARALFAPYRRELPTPHKVCARVTAEDHNTDIEPRIVVVTEFLNEMISITFHLTGRVDANKQWSCEVSMKSRLLFVRILSQV